LLLYYIMQHGRRISTKTPPEGEAYRDASKQRTRSEQGESRQRHITPCPHRTHKSSSQPRREWPFSADKVSISTMVLALFLYIYQSIPCSSVPSPLSTTLSTLLHSFALCKSLYDLSKPAILCFLIHRFFTLCHSTLLAFGM
jgi:hypothetical protein